MNVEGFALRSISCTVNATPFEEILNWLVPAAVIHAKRQAHEMVDG